MSHQLIQEFFILNVPNQVWQCGGSVEVLPCARIAHIERAHKPYTEDLTSHMRRNALRVAEVWMDEFKSHVYMAWNIPMEVSPLQGFTMYSLFIHTIVVFEFLSFLPFFKPNFMLSSGCHMLWCDIQGALKSKCSNMLMKYVLLSVFCF